MSLKSGKKMISLPNKLRKTLIIFPILYTRASRTWFMFEIFQDQIIFKKVPKNSKVLITINSSCQINKIFTKGQITLKIYFEHFNVALDKVLGHNIA